MFCACQVSPKQETQIIKLSAFIISTQFENKYLNIHLDKFLFCLLFPLPLDENKGKPSADLSIYCTIVWLVDGGG